MINTLVKKATLIYLMLIFSSSVMKAQMDCNVLYRYQNTPMQEILDRWSQLCKVEIEVDKNLIRNKTVTGYEDLIPLKTALNIILAEANLGWERTEDGSIRIAKKSKLNKYVTIKGKFKNSNLDKVFTVWKFNYKLDIDYDAREAKAQKVYGTIDNLSLEEAFERILAPTEFSFEIVGDRSIRVFKDLSKSKKRKVYANISENVSASGIVKDQDTGETLPFASVTVLNSDIGTTCNVDGLWSLDAIPTDTSVLEISYLGYSISNINLYPDMDLENIEVALQSEGVALDQITVSAVKKNQILKQSGISKISMTPEIASILPSYGERDIFRSLQLMPGVSGSNESSSGLFVRGGTPDQNLILLDGFTVYHVDHLFGFFSAFNSNAIKDVQLIKGGYGAQYGGRLSSVVDLTGKEGNTNEFNMGFNASLLSVNGFLESPFAKGKGSFIVTGRRSFQSSFYNNLFDSFTGNEEVEEVDDSRPLLAALNNTQVQPNSYFYDLNAKMTYRFDSGDKLSLSFYNGEDDLDNSRVTDSSQFSGGPFGGSAPSISFVNDNYDVSNWGNVGASLRWSKQWNSKLYSNTILSYSNYFSERDQTTLVSVEREDTTINRSSGSFEFNDLRDLSLNTNHEYQFSQNNKLSFGAQVTYNDIEYAYTQNDSISLIDRDDTALTSSIYISDRHTFGNKLILTGGLRLNHYDISDKWYVEPRASFTYLVSDRFKLKGAYGIYNQFATRVIREDIAQGSRDFWVLADDSSVPVSNAVHYVAGFSFDTDKYLFDVEFFLKDYNGLTEYTTRFTTSGFGPQRSLDLDETFLQGVGQARGVEFLAQRKFGNLTGWIGYTLSEVVYDFPDISENTFFANQDTRNEFKIIGTYSYKNWKFSSTFIYANGRPYTAPIGYYDIELLDGTTQSYFELSEKNALCYPDYHRLDISASLDFSLGDSKASLGMSVFNLYDNTNIWYKEFEQVEGQLIETDIELIGLTPSIFFNWTLK